ncbi:MAG: ribosome maturation factor RimM [Anaerorhabdus sp.]
MEKIRVGKIVNTFGLQGEVKVKSFTDFPEVRFGPSKRVYLEGKSQSIEKVIKSCREHKDHFLIRFKGDETINDVELYKECELFVDVEQLHKLAKGEFYYFELKGFEVFDENGNHLGYVKQVESGTTSNYLRIVSDDGINALVPFIEQFIAEVDSDNKKVIVKVIEGLL